MWGRSRCRTRARADALAAGEASDEGDGRDLGGVEGHAQTRAVLPRKRLGRWGRGGGDGGEEEAEDWGDGPVRLLWPLGATTAAAIGRMLLFSKS